MPESAHRLKIASYNVHSWKGTDHRTDPDRVMEVIRGFDADIVALQEVTSPISAGASCSLVHFAGANHYHVSFARTLQRRHSRYGNALLSRRRPVDIRRHDLECFGREPRSVLDAYFDFDGISVRVLTTHLGLSRKERYCQVASLNTLLKETAADMTLVVGDLNEWRPGSRLARRISELFGHNPAPRTFPSRWPLFSLDRIHIRPEERLLSLKAEKNALTRVASDHLPLLAEVDISLSAGRAASPLLFIGKEASLRRLDQIYEHGCPDPEAVPEAGEAT